MQSTRTITRLVAAGACAMGAGRALAQEHRLLVEVDQESLLSGRTFARSWALINDSDGLELDDPGACSKTFGPIPASIPFFIACTDEETEAQVGPSSAGSFALSRSHISIGVTPQVPCSTILAEWGWEGAAIAEVHGGAGERATASANGYASGRITGVFCGIMVFEFRLEPVGGEKREAKRVVVDPLVAAYTDPGTGEEIRRTLLETRIEFRDGEVEWQNDQFTSDAAELVLEISKPGEWTSGAGLLRLVVEDGEVTQSVATGDYVSIVLPPLGASGPVSIAIPNAQSLAASVPVPPGTAYSLDLDGGGYYEDDDATEPPSEEPRREERFEVYPPGRIDHFRTWQGWDDSPEASDFRVVTGNASSEPNALEIDGLDDCVLQTDARGGAWELRAMQYIPGDFTNGSDDQYAGTYFIVLNTYEHGGPYDWSIQMDYDGRDHLLRVYHGDGGNTIDVPYVPDRWVEIRASIDLDADWTRVYYDDELVAEYSWTGGALGDGTGVPEIAAIDLFANGSSPVLYDDVSLVRLDGGCAGDLDGDGDTDGNDFFRYLDLFAAGDPDADLDGDGDRDADDFFMYLDLFALGCP
ncbi:MAG: hypothetical protein H6811_03130 [Phycisphaeraceae bacterium]|nr:hypothetical protein [Phycisphaeraceae bacterium]